MNFPLKTNFSANFEKWSPWKRTTQIIKNYLAADWRMKKPYLKWSFPKNSLQEKTTNNCLIYGIMRLCPLLKTFNAGTTIKTLSQHSKQCKKCLFFITRKELTCWSSGVDLRICRIFVSTNLSVSNSILLLKPIKTGCKKIREDMVGAPSIVFTRKVVVDETFFRDSGNNCKSIFGIDAS